MGSPTIVLLKTMRDLKSSSGKGEESFHFLFQGIAKIDIALALLIATSELIFVAVPDWYIAVYNQFNINGEIIVGEFPHQTSHFLTVLILATFWLILEIWLYETLCKGTLELEPKLLNRWLNLRALFLFLSIFQMMYRIMDLQFCLYDVFFIPIVMYRVLEIIFVKGLVHEVRRFQVEVCV